MIDHDAHRKIPARWFRILSALIFVGACASSALAQQKPLLTEDVDIVRPGVIRIEVGFDFLQDQKFTLSGLRGDLTKIGDARLSFGMSSNIEFQIDWTVHNLLSVKSRVPSPIPLKLGLNESDTNDVGDVTLWMKMKLRNETARAPSLGFRFGIQLPNTDQALGIGTNTTNFYGMVTAGKKFHKDKLNLFGNVGLGILQAPLDRFTQNDVLLYGLAGIYSVSDKLNLVGEVNGFHSTRNHAPLGTEDFSTARLGAQIKALGLRWNAAGVFGLSDRAPKTGLSLGITYDWDAFTPVK
ncbi:MAG: hypothetical protein DMF61_14510 [Blastocatellia bacterium AA13]|nr:MAG: hypothetical protein DMF61_14510 [Blastocatellia bacterium AA13]